MKQKTGAFQVSVIVIAAILVAGVLYYASDIAAPMTLAVVTGIIAAPVLDAFCRLGLPVGVAASVILLLTLGVIATAVVAFEPVFWRFVDAIPAIRWEIREIVFEFRETLRSIGNVNEEMKEALGGGNGDGSSDEGASVPSVTDALFAAPAVLGQVLIFAGTLYFFMVNRLEVYSFLARRLSAVGETELIKRRFRVAERLVSRYFVAITIVNFSLGIAVTAIMTALGMPLPYVWGLGAALLNYVLYLGPAVMVVVLLLGGLVHFEGLMVAAPPVLFMLVNLIEAQFVTPAFVGRHVRLNPLLVFMALVIGLWFWGPIGGIVAIPVLVIAVAMSDDSLEAQTRAVRPS
ncbi:Predicted PurR-regulated permease PerM [Roseivivax lentus]|uniref:Predicted PurR-regulated permease PerM n=1 Tax=Roseivivax lentus TaxID=633194 RepID=A0A1N7PIS8_9RHOB|nr:AI-2E family transporter [Roseivivax lentus]SIT10553.1 Predicted PurR-regulated permease PerM [Roseivivax lentus]